MSSGYAVEATAIPSSLLKKQKVKKPGLIKRWLLSQIKDAVDSERAEKDYEERLSLKSISVDRSPARIDSDKGIRFQVYRATGGFVIETAMYDRQKDRHLNSLHIITDDQDLGEQIGKIITMEALKQ